MSSGRDENRSGGRERRWRERDSSPASSIISGILEWDPSADLGHEERSPGNERYVLPQPPPPEEGLSMLESMTGRRTPTSPAPKLPNDRYLAQPREPEAELSMLESMAVRRTGTRKPPPEQGPPPPKPNDPHLDQPPDQLSTLDRMAVSMTTGTRKAPPALLRSRSEDYNTAEVTLECHISPSAHIFGIWYNFNFQYLPYQQPPAPPKRAYSMTMIELGTLGFERRKEPPPVHDVLQNLRAVRTILS
jgi:hypothetical protein